VTELDLGLKVTSRRLLWRMGFATRIDVPLRAFIPTSKARGRQGRYESFTDLDVLGVGIAPGFSVQTVISDCKTSPRGSTERMFWIRGVADFFQADEAWMVRSAGVTAAARQLSGRLRISVLEPTDLARLEEYHPTDLPLSEPGLSFLFSEEAVARYMKAFTVLDKKLDKLLEYRQFDYWVYDEHRNLIQLVAHLAEAVRHLDASQPAHRAIFYELAWLYTLSLAHAAAHIRAVHVTDIDTSLREYLFGGQVEFQEKQKLAVILSRLASRGAPTSAEDGVLPSWYPSLLELLTRQLRRPRVVADQLRYAEWIAENQLANQPHGVAEAFGPAFSPLAAKLLADVCGFLVTVTKLDPAFRAHARSALAQALPTAQESDEPPTSIRGRSLPAQLELNVGEAELTVPKSRQESSGSLSQDERAGAAQTKLPAWNIEYRTGQTYALRNVGARPSTHVMIDAGSSIARNLPEQPGVTLEPGQAHAFMLIGAMGAPLPTDVVVSSAELGSQHVPIPGRLA
jgi:hypothetical protein